MVPSAKSWQQRYLRTFYRANPEWRDGTEEFHALCAAHIPSGSRILEIGAGPSNPTSRFLATLGELHGVDPDRDVLGNDALKSATVFENGTFPFADESFDACVSNYVIEHVADADMHLREVRRVLRRHGVYVFRTPNRLHYVALAARLTPHRVHVLLANRLRNQHQEAHDPYPTLYVCNSARAVRRFAKRAGLEIAELRMIEKEPSYGMSSRVLFLAFLAYERLVNSARAMAAFRANILAVLKKG